MKKSLWWGAGMAQLIGICPRQGESKHRATEMNGPPLSVRLHQYTEIKGNGWPIVCAYLSAKTNSGGKRRVFVNVTIGGANLRIAVSRELIMTGMFRKKQLLRLLLLQQLLLRVLLLN